MNDPEKISRVAVIGAGIGGLMSALALQNKGIQVTVFERDATPGLHIAPADSMTWLRKGVPQSLHPHFFMGRLRVLLEEKYPDLITRLLQAGAGESSVYDYVHPSMSHRLQSKATDHQLRTLNCRRTTFEMIVRQYTQNLPGITINSEAQVTGLQTSINNAGLITVNGVRLSEHSDTPLFMADAVIDASGRFSKLSKQLLELGAPIVEDQRDSGIWYFTRHYRLNAGQSFPQTFGLPGAQFPDFTVGALPADNNTFTITFQVYREDKTLATALKEPEHFQKVCLATKLVAPWVSPERATPTSDVYGFGQMDSYWRKSVIDGQPTVLNFFCVGDSALRSNPKYGRGCTWTTLAAHHLADLLAQDLSAEDRIVRYEDVLETEFRADWLTMRNIDLSTERAFAIAMGTRQPNWMERISLRVQTFVNDAIITEPALFRDLWTGYNGFQNMSAWANRPMNWLRLLRAWTERLRNRSMLESQRGRMSHTQMTTRG